jgi:pimeloyl-ACP methyl ester carboxylesterase
VAFDVIIPSLPGFAFSSPPPENWTAGDTARVFNTLMTDILGYSAYATHGTDWGCGIAYDLYDNFNTSVKAIHLAFLPFSPLQPDALAAQNITLSPLEEVEEQNFVAWSSTGNGYFAEQSTKVYTLQSFQNQKV